MKHFIQYIYNLDLQFKKKPRCCVTCKLKTKGSDLQIQKKIKITLKICYMFKLIHFTILGQILADTEFDGNKK